MKETVDDLEKLLDKLTETGSILGGKLIKSSRFAL